MTKHHSPAARINSPGEDEVDVRRHSRPTTVELILAGPRVGGQHHTRITTALAAADRRRWQRAMCHIHGWARSGPWCYAGIDHAH
jgi:hypothetical protein